MPSDQRRRDRYIHRSLNPPLDSACEIMQSLIKEGVLNAMQ
jgi:hypothetical protein